MMTAPSSRGKDTAWWIVSGGVHAVAFILVTYVTPIHDLVFESSLASTEFVVSGDRLQEIVDEMREFDRRKMVAAIDGTRRREGMRDWLAVLLEIRDRRLAQLNSLPGGPASASDLDPDALKGGRYRPDAPLAEKNVAEIFDVARDLEQTMVDVYRQVRAVRMAMLQEGLSFAEAFETATVMRPVRAKLEASVIEQEVRNARDGRLEAMKSELKLGGQEIKAMEAYARKLVAFAKEIDERDDFLTVEMADDEEEDLGGEYRGATLMPDEMYDSHEYSMGSFHAFAGRKLMGEGDPNLWMFVDTWYIIGPFPNAGRQNINTRFGPEAGVDLDASYVGKDGREVRWEFHKQFIHKIEPKDPGSYEIYYAWSEVYSDRERDAWIATGTDDLGKLWVNDEPVWVSSEVLKPYNASENIQMIRLKEGVNAVLFRCENAGGTMGFSLLMCTREE